MSETCMDRQLTLPLDDMADRHYGLTPELAGTYLQAARVALHRHHVPPQEFSLQHGTEIVKAIVRWEPPCDRHLAAWGNQDDTTRDGAYACALATIELLLGLYAVHRAQTRTGSDYYVAPQGKTIEDLEDCIRVEVSGTTLDAAEVRRRLRIKVQQALNGASDLPAIAIVVGFLVKLITLQTVEAPA